MTKTKRIQIKNSDRFFLKLTYKDLFLTTIDNETNIMIIVKKNKKKYALLFEADKNMFSVKRRRKTVR